MSPELLVCSDSCKLKLLYSAKLLSNSVSHTMSSSLMHFNRLTGIYNNRAKCTKIGFCPYYFLFFMVLIATKHKPNHASESLHATCNKTALLSSRTLLESNVSVPNSLIMRSCQLKLASFHQSQYQSKTRRCME